MTYIAVHKLREDVQGEVQTQPVLMEAPMTDIAYGTLASAQPDKTAKPAKTPVGKPERKSLFRRIFEIMIEARRLQAETMVKRHLYGSF